MILGIDPGNEETAYCLTANGLPVEADKVANAVFLDAILPRLSETAQHVAIESIQNYGMAVGQSVFQTCYMIGKILRECETRRLPHTLYPRPEYAKAIAGVMKVNDAVLRQALLVRFGGDKKGEPLFILKGNSDKRSAFAVAVYHRDKEQLAA